MHSATMTDLVNRWCMFKSIGGRFVMIWLDQGCLWLTAALNLAALAIKANLVGFLWRDISLQNVNKVYAQPSTWLNATWTCNTTSERAENTYIQSLLRCANHHVWSNSYNRTDLLFYWNIKLWILVISWFNLNDMKSFLKERVVHVCLSLITGIILTHATSLWAT